MKFGGTTFLLLKYSLEDLKNLFMISNCFYHLFSCPRSVFARNDCVYCSRVFIKEVDKPKTLFVLMILILMFFLTCLSRQICQLTVLF